MTTQTQPEALRLAALIESEMTCSRDADVVLELRSLYARFAELEANDQAVISTLAACRGAFPTPEPGTPLERLWVAAIGDPESVPDYVQAQIAQLRESKPQCEWTYNDDYFHWQTSCGHAHLFGDGGTHDNKYSHCPYCGGGIGEKTP